MEGKDDEMPKSEFKCPKCGEDRAVEVVTKFGTKVEIYCNTCGKSSIIDTDERGDDDEE